MHHCRVLSAGFYRVDPELCLKNCVKGTSSKPPLSSVFIIIYDIMNSVSITTSVICNHHDHYRLKMYWHFLFQSHDSPHYYFWFNLRWPSAVEGRWNPKNSSSSSSSYFLLLLHHLLYFIPHPSFVSRWLSAVDGTLKSNS